jgi:hypothetical protein
MAKVLPTETKQQVLRYAQDDNFYVAIFETGHQVVSDESFCSRKTRVLMDKKALPQGLKPASFKAYIVRAKARTYLRSKNKSNSRFLRNDKQERQQQIPAE